MPEIPEPPKERWVCCCETDPPSLRCGMCSWPYRDHNACTSPTKVTLR